MHEVVGRVAREHEQARHEARGRDRATARRVTPPANVARSTGRVAHRLPPRRPRHLRHCIHHASPRQRQSATSSADVVCGKYSSGSAIRGSASVASALAPSPRDGDVGRATRSSSADDAIARRQEPDARPSRCRAPTAARAPARLRALRDRQREFDERVRRGAVSHARPSTPRVALELVLERGVDVRARAARGSTSRRGHQRPASGRQRPASGPPSGERTTTSGGRTIVRRADRRRSTAATGSMAVTAAGSSASRGSGARGSASRRAREPAQRGHEPRWRARDDAKHRREGATTGTRVISQRSGRYAPSTPDMDHGAGPGRVGLESLSAAVRALIDADVPGRPIQRTRIDGAAPRVNRRVGTERVKAGSGAPMPPLAWIVVAHVLGAAAIGGLDAARVGSASVALAVVPIFAATGLVAGGLVAIARARGLRAGAGGGRRSSCGADADRQRAGRARPCSTARSRRRCRSRS